MSHATKFRLTMACMLALLTCDAAWAEGPMQERDIFTSATPDYMLEGRVESLESEMKSFRDQLWEMKQRERHREDRERHAQCLEDGRTATDGAPRVWLPGDGGVKGTCLRLAQCIAHSSRGDEWPHNYDCSLEVWNNAQEFWE